jgi:hypothetical protein
MCWPVAAVVAADVAGLAAAVYCWYGHSLAGCLLGWYCCLRGSCPTSRMEGDAAAHAAPFRLEGQTWTWLCCRCCWAEQLGPCCPAVPRLPVLPTALCTTRQCCWRSQHTAPTRRWPCLQCTCKQTSGCSCYACCKTTLFLPSGSCMQVGSSLHVTDAPSIKVIG